MPMAVILFPFTIGILVAEYLMVRMSLIELALGALVLMVAYGSANCLRRRFQKAAKLGLLFFLLVWI